MKTEKKSEAKKGVQPEKRTHSYTKVVNDAIEKHGSPFLKHLSKDAPLVDSFHYRNGKGFIKVGSNFINGRQVSTFRKGIMWLNGEAASHIQGLPQSMTNDLVASVMQTLINELSEGQDQRQVLLQAFNRKVQDDINAAVEAAGHEPFIFEQDYVNSAGSDSKVFVMMAYNEHFPSDERLDEIEATNLQRKMAKMAKAATGGAVDARSAEYAKTTA